MLPMCPWLKRPVRDRRPHQAAYRKSSRKLSHPRIGGPGVHMEAAITGLLEKVATGAIVSRGSHGARGRVRVPGARGELWGCPPQTSGIHLLCLFTAERSYNDAR